MGEYRGLLRIGGLGALPAGILWVFALILVGVLDLGQTAEEALLFAQEVGALYVIQPMVYLIAQLLTVPLFLGLHRVSRDAGPSRALVGVVLGVSGTLIYVANWAIVVTAFPVLSDLHAVAPPAEQTMIVYAAEVVEQITHAFQSLAQLLIGLAFISFGWVLLARHDIAMGYGWAGIVLGGIVALHALVSFSGFPFALILGGFGGMGVLFLLFGWKLYSLSRAA